MSKFIPIISITLIVLAAFIGSYVVVQKPQIVLTSASDISPSQCSKDGGFLWGNNTCPPGFIKKAGVDDGYRGSGPGGDQQGTICCVPQLTTQPPTPTAIPRETPIKTPPPTEIITQIPRITITITHTPTPTPTPTPGCPNCAPVVVLPVPGDPLGRPSCSSQCNFSFVQDPNSCAVKGDIIKIRLDQDGCVTFDIDGSPQTKCGKKGQILTFPANRSGKITTTFTCDGDTQTLLDDSIAQQGDIIQVSPTGDPSGSICRKQIIILCQLPTPTVTPRITPIIPKETPPGSCKLPQPKLIFRCEFGCTPLESAQ